MRVFWCLEQLLCKSVEIHTIRIKEPKNNRLIEHWGIYNNVKTSRWIKVAHGVQRLFIRSKSWNVWTRLVSRKLVLTLPLSTTTTTTTTTTATLPSHSVPRLLSHILSLSGCFYYHSIETQCLSWFWNQFCMRHKMRIAFECSYRIDIEFQSESNWFLILTKNELNPTEWNGENMTHIKFIKRNDWRRQITMGEQE